jgi:hypothetical protein
LYIIATERTRLVSWRRQFFNAACTITLSYIAYDRIIRFKINILPDFTTIANELWLAIGLFIYVTINGIQAQPVGGMRRRRAYVKQRATEFQRRFGEIVTAEARSRDFEALVYSVMVYEAFNRPWIVRVFESKIFFRLGWSSTLGVMQVQTTRSISDAESVVAGTRALRRDFDSAYAKLLPRLRNEYAAYSLFGEDSDHLATQAAQAQAEAYALRRYNVRSDYAGEVLLVKQWVTEDLFPDLVPHDADEVY